LLSRNQEEISSICLENTILPLLSKPDKFSQSIDKNSQNIIKILYNIAETLVSFKDNEKYMINYKNLTNQILNPSLLKQLIDEFIKNFDKFKDSSISDLFKLRLTWLTNVLKNVPEFSWIMEGKLDGHPIVENFLRSENSTMIYESRFNGIKDAQNFTTKYNGLKRGYSVEMLSSGKGKSSQVVIKKTRELFQNQLNYYKNFQIEYKLIENYLMLFSYNNNNNKKKLINIY